MVLHPSPTLNHFRYSRQGPQVGTKTVSARPLPQRLLDLSELPAVQLGSASRAPRSLQRLGTSPLPLLVPPTHTLATHLQFASDGRQDQLAGREQSGGMPAPVFQPLEIPSLSNKGMHADSVGYNEPFVTVLCEIQ